MFVHSYLPLFCLAILLNDSVCHALVSAIDRSSVRAFVKGDDQEFESTTKVPAHRRNVLDTSSPGLVTDTMSCNPKMRFTISETVKNARNLLVAAQQDLQSEDRTLFHYFFNDADHPTVTTVLKNLYDRLSKKGPTIGIVCASGDAKLDNLLVKCYENGGIAGTVQSPASANDPRGLIFECPRFWQIRDLPDPCSMSYLEMADGKEWRGYSKANNLIYNILVFPGVTGNSVWSIKDEGINPAFGCHMLKKYPGRYYDAAIKPTLNPDSYTNYIQWAWMRSQQKSACPSSYPLWNVLTSGHYDEPADFDRIELRKILSTSAKEDPFICPEDKSLDACLAQGLFQSPK